MMKTLSKRVTIGALGAVVCLGFAAPLAHADVIETGTKTCGGSTPFSYVQYKTKGDRAVRAPGSGTTAYGSGSSTSWYTSSRQGATGGGSWFVNGYVDLDQSYTKGLCKNYG